jgi:hypothetical protein|tara:strand:+ start:635 stop:865 length:231 start_codon:yes stop_codon:yes gene_type:complete
MEKVFSYLNGFLGGMGALFMSLIPVTILWFVLTGGSVFGMDAIANLTSLVTGFGEGGFVGLVVLVLIASLFVGSKK